MVAIKMKDRVARAVWIMTGFYVAAICGLVFGACFVLWKLARFLLSL